MADNKDTTTGGLRTDTYGKAAKLDPAADLKVGESKKVASGGEDLNKADVLPVPPSDKVRDEAQVRAEAGIPEPPKPALYTDLHVTSGGYQVTPAGVSPEELEDRKDTRK